MLIAAVVAAATLAGGAIGQKGSTGIDMRAVRFWVPDAKATVVLGFVDVPYGLSSPIGDGPQSFIAYEVTVRVVDEKGKEFVKESWSRHALAALRSQGATGMEEVNFPLKSGAYYFAVTVKDSATGRVTTDSIRVDGFDSAPTGSDLLVANDMRLVPPTDSASQPGEIARGPYRFVPSPTPLIDVTHPNLAYMIEAYSPDSTSAQLDLTLTTMTGDLILQVAPVMRSVAAGGGVLTGRIPLEGLPPGQYLLKSALTVHGKKVERQAVFAMGEAKAALARSVALTAQSRGIDEIYFRSIPEDSIDAQEEELSLLPGVTKRDLAPYKKEELSLTAKQNFMIQFWSQRDRNKTTPQNEDRLAFYAAVDYANANYSEHGRPGWKTDRGRIYARYGAPDDSLVSHMAGEGLPYLVWRMTHGKPRWFIFGDRTNTNQWQLLVSNEPSEPGSPTSVFELVKEQSQEIAQWLGLQKCYFYPNPGDPC